jgi:Tfp pilus assembly protein PilX
MSAQIISRSPRQRGAVLIVSLIMLAVMSLFVISMLKTSILELKIGGASHVAQLNFANAEFAINKWINDNNGRLAPSFLGITPLAAGCNVTTAGAGQCTDPPAVFGGNVAITPTQIHCGPWAQFGSMMGSMQLSAVQFDIRSMATGTLGGTTIVHQGVQSLAPPGAC